MINKRIHTSKYNIVRIRRLFIIVLLHCTMGLSKAFAFDFWAVCPSGDTLYYGITNLQELEVAVVRPGSYSWYEYTEPSGDIIMQESVTNPNDGLTYSVVSIASSAFQSCGEITSLIVPNSVTTIESSAFSGCISLASLIIPKSVVFIGNYAFSECRNLVSIIIPESVSSIGSGVFSTCDNLANISVASGNTMYDSRNDCNAIIETNTNVLIAGCKNSIIPNSVTAIGDYAFNRCYDLSTIVIPSSINSIGNYAFYFCKNLTSISIGDSVKSIGNNAFSCCKGLMDITIPNSVIFIGAHAFTECSNLKSITIGASVTTIGAELFTYCDNLEKIIVEPGNPYFDSRENCNAIIRTNTNCLLIGCKSSFIPNSVTSIGSEAFYKCRGLSSIVIPNSVASLESWAFKETTMTNVIVLGVVPPFLGGNAFEGNGKLIVSCGNKEAYENSDWNSYFEVIEEGCGTYDIYKAICGNNGAGGSFVSLPSCSQMEDLVCFSLIPNPGCHVASVIVQKSDNPFQTIPITQGSNGENDYCFVMPPFAVSVRATFAIGNAINENSDIPVSIYPNPTSGKIRLESENLKQISICNMLGQLVFESEAESDCFEYDFSYYGFGVYLIRITTSDGIATKRIVVTQ